MHWLLSFGHVAGVYTLGGRLSPRAKAQSAGAAVSAILRNADADSRELFLSLNKAEQIGDGVYANPVNDAAFVCTEWSESIEIDASVIRFGWERLFSKVCRPIASALGDLGPRTVRDDYRFIVHEIDTSLGDNGNVAQTWLSFVPT
jgi:hypothetical protein